MLAPQQTIQLPDGGCLQTRPRVADLVQMQTTLRLADLVRMQTTLRLAETCLRETIRGALDRAAMLLTIMGLGADQRTDPGMLRGDLAVPI